MEPRRQIEPQKHRIPCKRDTFFIIRDYASALHMTYDEALQYMYKRIAGDEDPSIAGARARKELEYEG